MNKSLEKNYITENLNKIFMRRFEMDLFNNQLNINLDDNFLGRKYKFRARDLLYLVFDLENEFDINISYEDIDEIKLNTLRNVITIIKKELEQKKEDVI